jgi:predicted dehydrogenase
MWAIIGYGEHVKKNIIRLFNLGSDLKLSFIYVRDKKKYKEDVFYPYMTEDLDVLLNDTKLKYVYIATPISTHYEYADIFLKNRKNVLCEKIMTESFSKTKKLFDVAFENNVQLSEVTMFKFHRQFSYIENLVKSSYKKIESFEAKFTIPELDSNNIRYRKDLGGGALYDVGYYPISLAIALFGEPENETFNIEKRHSFSVDLFGSAVFSYGHFNANLEWAIGKSYQNYCVFNFGDSVFKFERCFSKPNTLSTSCTIIQQGQEDIVSIIEADDQFYNLFKAFEQQTQTTSIASKDVLILVKLVEKALN